MSLHEKNEKEFAVRNNASLHVAQVKRIHAVYNIIYNDVNVDSS